MQVCIMIVGTHGDVAPFVGIGKRLQKDGHRVRLATHATYRRFVTKNGLEFYPLAGDPKELSAYMVKTSGHIVSFNYEVLTKDTPRNIKTIDEILHSTWPAVSARDPDGNPLLPPFRAQAIISNPVTYGHVHVAEKLGVPLHIMFPQPWVPTQEFPHPLSNLPYKGKSEKRNATSYHVVDALMWAGTEGLVNSFRQEVLGLSKIRKGAPAKGFMKVGLAGAGVGAVKGFGGLVVRPLNGVAQFATRVAVGAHNEKAAEHGGEQLRVRWYIALDRLDV
ncbi:unnamed protein product [Aphanomyces euteiches]|uniref:Glycosyltransferase family 28 N-terminal domain-containing protein n=1 Tax=Aphanomyces euteiches TaxID=100861 RepID=A0A6G0XXP7_9STRA|nr:hypothetical protein Ae201684_000345 [Aphanomyces euteiches]KAH9091840.1 hypothetical protein Ae201684P_011383 [Aphanomyces euteiches]